MSLKSGTKTISNLQHELNKSLQYHSKVGNKNMLSMEMANRNMLVFYGSI